MRRARPQRIPATCPRTAQVGKAYISTEAVGVVSIGAFEIRLIGDGIASIYLHALAANPEHRSHNGESTGFYGGARLVASAISVSATVLVSRDPDAFRAGPCPRGRRNYGMSRSSTSYSMPRGSASLTIFLLKLERLMGAFGP